MSIDWKYLPVNQRENPPFPLVDGEKLVQCPYDANHKVLDYKAHTHFNKCRRQHIKKCQLECRAPEFVVCKYNQLHHIRVKNLNEHYKTCEGAKELQGIFEEPAPDFAPKFYLEEPLVPVKKTEKVVSHGKFEVCDEMNFDDDDSSCFEPKDDDWETCRGTKFDFAKHQDKKYFTKQPVGLTKSEKKERMEKVLERRHLKDSRDVRHVVKLQNMQEEGGWKVKKEDSWE